MSEMETGYEASWELTLPGHHIYHQCDRCGESVIGKRLWMAYFPVALALSPRRPLALLNRWWVGDCCREQVYALLEPHLALEALK